MKTFEHFPETNKCILCGTNKDGICVLAGMDGTSDGNIEEAIPIHVDCIKLRYSPELKMFYQKCLKLNSRTQKNK